MSETGNGRKNWTRVVAAVGLVFLAVAIALLIGLLFWYCSGISGILSGYPAIHRYSGRYVLRTWSDSYHQY